MGVDLFPMLDLKFGKKPLAIIIRPGKRILLKWMKPFAKGFFWVRYDKISGGLFMIDDSKRLVYEKIPVYIYDTTQGKPLDIPALRLLWKFRTKNNLHRIRRSDIQKGSKIRRFMLRGKDLKDIDKEATDMTELNIESDSEAMKDVTDTLKSETQELYENMAIIDKEVKDEMPNEDQNFQKIEVVNRLMHANLIDGDQAEELDKLIKTRQDFDFSQLANFMSERKVLDIFHPVPIEVETFTEDFGNYNPSEPIQAIMMARHNEKQFEKMASGTVFPKIPIAGIMLLIMGAVVAIAVLGGQDLSNFENMLPSPPSWFPGG